MKQETPQWEKELARMAGLPANNFMQVITHSSAKALIKSTLEEVIEKIDKNMEQASGGGSWRRVWIQTKAQLRKEFL